MLLLFLLFWGGEEEGEEGKTVRRAGNYFQYVHAKEGIYTFFNLFILHPPCSNSSSSVFIGKRSSYTQIVFIKLVPFAF